MKAFNMWKIFALSAVVLATVTGCSKDDPKPYDGTPVITVNGAETTNATVGIAGGAVTPSITVSSTGDWGLGIDGQNSTWLHPSVTSGSAGEATVTFTADAAPAGTTTRSAVVTLTTSGIVAGYPVNKTATINVRQGEARTTTVADVRTYIKNMAPGTTISEDKTLTGVVISNVEAGGFGGNKTCIISDINTTNSGAGVAVRFNAAYTYKVGDMITANLNGSTVDNYQGLVQIKPKTDDIFSVLSSNETVTPIEISDPSKLNEYQSQLVKVINTQPVTAVRGTKYYTVTGTATYSSPGFETKTGVNYALSIYQTNSWAKELDIPAKSGYLIGIAGVNNGKNQLSPRTADDVANLTEELFTQEYAESTIANIGAAGNYIVKNGVVVATYKNGFIMNDGTGYMLVYQFVNASTPYTVPAVGAKLDVKGTVESYGTNGGVLQFGNNNLTLTANGTGTVPSISPETMDGAKIDTYAAAPYVKYVKYTGKLTKAGNFINVAIDNTDVIGSVAYPNDDLNVASFDGKFVIVTGWAYGVSTSQNLEYVQTMVTNIVEDTNINWIDAEATAKFTYEAGVKDVTFTSNVLSGNSVYAKLDDAAWFSIPAGAITGGKVAVTMAENATDADKAAMLTIYIAASENGTPLASTEVNLTQTKKPSGGGYTMIDKVADLTAGTYLMGGYLEESTGTGATVFRPYSNHLWVGTVDAGDCVTTPYEFKDAQLTMKPGATTGNAVPMQLVAAGAANTYYIKIGAKYLKSGSAANRKLTLVDAAAGAEWVFTNSSLTGINVANGGVNLGSANAASKIMRSYVNLDTLKGGLFFFKEN